MSSARAFIFDMDGVLIDSTPSHTEAWQRYLAARGIGMDDISSRMLGKHNDEIVREFFRGSELSPEETFRHGAEKERLYREIRSLRIYEGASEVQQLIIARELLKDVGGRAS